MDEKLTFESALQKLEEINNALENNNCSLNDSIKLYEEGLKLSKYCEKILSKASLKITKIQNDMEHKDE